MSALPLNISRMPNMLRSQVALSNLTRTNVSLFGIQQQLATGRSVNRPSDDPVRAAAILSLDSRLELGDQRLRNLDHATTSLNVLDSALGDVSDMILEAKTIASQQSNVGSSHTERKSQALVVQSLLDGLFETVNRKSISGHLFGGSAPGKRPVEPFQGGYRYVGQGNGLVTGLGLGSAVPVTLGRTNPIAPTAARVHGTVSFDLDLTPDTRLEDLRGARGLGVTPGVLELSFNGLPASQFDLSGADTVQDAVDQLRAAIRTYEQDHNAAILGPGGVSINGGSISIDVLPDSAGGPNPVLKFFDVTGGAAAEDLGLTSSGAAVEFTATESNGIDLDPRLTWRTPAELIDGSPLGQLKIENAGQSRTLDLSGVETFSDIRAIIEGANIGVRVEIDQATNKLNIINEVSAGRAGAMSISEVGAGDSAERLGIHSFSGLTRVSDFNFGAGVQVLSGRVDPVSGQPDPMLDRDFSITLGNGRSFDVNLSPGDMATVDSIIAKINSEAASQSIAVPSEFEARISTTNNGLAFVQDPSYAQPIQIDKLNDSPAFAQLGLSDGEHGPGGATFTGSNRTKVRVAGVFSDLLDLKEALNKDDTFGIVFAAEHLEESVDNVSQSRALVGGFTNRVAKATITQEDQMLLDERVRSDMRDLDFAHAAVRLNLLQTQLAAGLQTTAMMGSRTLLDFLG